MNKILGSIALFVATTSLASQNPMSFMDYYNAPASPIFISANRSETDSITSYISAASGGTISLKSSDGTLFTLTIPANSLFQDEDITLTALTSTKLSNSQDIIPSLGVEISPDGLLLKSPAILSIVPATPIPLTELSAFTSQQNNSEVALATLANKAFDPKNIEIQLLHFSNYSIIGNMTIGESIYRAFSSFTFQRIQSWLADQFKNQKEGKPVADDFVNKAAQEYLDKVLKPMANSVDSCEGGRRTMGDFLALTRQLQLLGSDITDLLNNNALDVLANKTESKCLERAKVACYEDHRPFEIFKFYLGLARQYQLMGRDESLNLKAFRELALKCAHFELEINSTIGTSDKKNGFEVTAKSKFPFQIDFSMDKPVGQIDVVDMDFHAEGLSCVRKSLEADPDAVIIKYFGLSDTQQQDSDTLNGNGNDDDYLRVNLGQMRPRSIGHFMCTEEGPPPFTFPIDLPQVSPPGMSEWGGLFTEFHGMPGADNEYDAKTDSFKIQKWNMKFSEIWAVKKYSREKEGVLREDTVMTIYHRPVQ